MKKIPLFASLVIMATMTACSITEPTEVPTQNENTPIGFAPLANKQTKALPIDGATIQGEALILKSYLTNEQAFKDYSNVPDKWIDGNITYQSSKWATDFTYYWPSNAKYNLSFFTYTPNQHGDNGDVTIPFTDAAGYVNGSITYPSFNFIVPKDISKQVDLLAAAAIDKKKVMKSGSGNAAEPVTFKYKHLLSQVSFKAKTTDNNFRIKISSLKVKGAKNSATFTYNGTEDVVGVWTKLSGSAEHVYRSGSTPTDYIKEAAVIVEPNGDIKSGIFMLMPQPQDNNFIIEVIYSIYNATTDVQLVKDIKKTTQMKALERGKKYGYTLILPQDESLTPIEFSVEVADWADATNHEVKIQPYKLVATATDPTGGAGVASWANNAKHIEKYAADFANKYDATLNPNGHTDKSSYTHTIELSGELTDNLRIDLGTALTSINGVTAGSKVIIDAVAINTWVAGKKITIVTPLGWKASTIELSATGTITITKE